MGLAFGISPAAEDVTVGRSFAPSHPVGESPSVPLGTTSSEGPGHTAAPLSDIGAGEVPLSPPLPTLDHRGHERAPVGRGLGGDPLAARGGTGAQRGAGAGLSK